MKLVGCYITCLIFQDVPASAGVKVNGQKLKLRGTDLKSNQSYIRLSLQRLETIFSKQDSLNIQISIDGGRVARLQFSYQDYILCHKNLPKDLLPEMIHPFLLGSNDENTNIQKTSDFTSAEIEEREILFDATLSGLSASLAKASTDNASAYQQFIQNRPDLAEIVLDNAKDELYFNRAVSLFGLDLSVLNSRLPHLHYHANLKIPYYALQIIRHSKASANQKNQAVDKLLEFLLELAAKHDDFWDTTYFQKSLCLVYSMLPLDIERKNLLALIDRSGAELLLEQRDVDLILEDTTLPAEAFICAFATPTDAEPKVEDIVALISKSTKNYRDRRRINRLILTMSNSLKEKEFRPFLEDEDILLRWYHAHPIFSIKQHPLPLPGAINFKAKKTNSTVFVALYSCNKYLDDRVQTCYDTWFASMPYAKAIFVGKELTGSKSEKLKHKVQAPVLEHLVTLDVADDYENLPLKTLKLIQWFLDNTEEDYLFKVDDDCFINADNFSFLASTLSKHYVGKVIKRGIGGGRFWHQDKSSSEFAKQTPDLSPDGSVYCDGGIGYFLSREVCRQVIMKYNTLQGRLLCEHSFYEDKLIGDLLAGSNYTASEPLLPYANRRRNESGEVPVAKWGANILPSKHTATYIAHTDNFKDVERLHKTQSSNKHGFNELIFDFGRLYNSGDLRPVEVIRRRKFDKNKPLLIAVGYNESAIMPAFFDHYRKIGIQQFAILDNCSTDGSLDYLITQPDIFVFSSSVEYSKANYGVAWQRLLMDYFNTFRNLLMVDFDEFLIRPGSNELDINDLLQNFNTDFICSLMVDFYAGPESKPLKGAIPSTSEEMFEAYSYYDKDPVVKIHEFSRQNNFPVYTNLCRQRLANKIDWERFAAQKGVIFKNNPCISASIGLHDVNGRHQDLDIYLAHFKYTESFSEKVEREVVRKQHWNNAEEYEEYASNIQRYKSPYSKKYSTKYNPLEFHERLKKIKEQ
ncbi:glycosyltransferase family 2 protein [SAR116 cluster bacterium]|nr:glycosyltransferase family 2 protein [SAR116 cluster bacterium]